MCPEYVKVNNVRFQGHEPGMGSFNFLMLNVCQLKYCVPLFEDSGLCIGFKVTCERSSAWMLRGQGRFRPWEDLTQTLVNRICQELSRSISNAASGCPGLWQ